MTLDLVESVVASIDAKLVHVLIENDDEVDYWRMVNGQHIGFKGKPGHGTPVIGNSEIIDKINGDESDSSAKVTESNWKKKFGEIAKKVGHQLVHPFVAAKDLLTKPEARKELADHVKKSVRKETKETKHLVSTIKKAVSGEKISKEDKTRAVNQAVDLVKVALIGATVAHLFHGGVMKAIGTLASPVDEVVGVAVDAPLRKITEKVFGSAHGILPSAFYEESENEHDVMDRVIDAIIDEIAKSNFSEKV